MKKLLFFVLAVLFSIVCDTAEAVERKQLFDDGWKFNLSDAEAYSSTDYNDKTWRTVTLPHDWSVESTPHADAAVGNDGGYFDTGIGWYRKTFTVAKNQSDKQISLFFEGVYMDAEVFINGHSLGVKHYGYSSFTRDLTPYLVYGKPNVLAVRVDNSKQKNCRWYSGSGIYRHVWLITTPDVYFEDQSTAIVTPTVSRAVADVQVTTTVVNKSGKQRKISVIANVQGADEVSLDITLAPGEKREVKMAATVQNPRLWSPETPYVYTAKLSVLENNKKIDAVSERFGIRTISYSADKGFQLNGKTVKVFGGCMHHDNGILGAAAFTRAEVRKVQMMKKAGFNAIRTSHNPPSVDFLNACDSIGVMVIDEAFDGWRDAKNDCDYHTIFDEFYREDIAAMVKRDRNHPSIISWSVGNEVIERKKLEVVRTAHNLAEECRKYDTTRPVTQALASWDDDWEIYDPLAAEHEVIGYNYLIHKAEGDHQRVPNRVIWQTESYPREAFSNWCKVHDNSYIVGDFVWTSLDYLGESGIGRYYYEGDTPGEHWEHPLYPWHGAYCGDIDLTGWRKPFSYYRQLLFNPNSAQSPIKLAVKEPDEYVGKIHETLWSLYPTWESWNWEGWENKPIDVVVYSRCESVRLYLNGKLVGEKPTNRSTEFMATFNVPYQSGELKAVGVLNGKNVAEQILRTASKPAEIRLTADRIMINADGQDLSFITIEVVDAQGNVCPNAEVELTVEVKNDKKIAGTLQALGNANLQDTGSYADNHHSTWKGRALAVVRSTKEAGEMKVIVSGENMPKSEITIIGK
jgi:beta-galactosidase